MYTIVMYDDGTFKIVKGNLLLKKNCFPDKCRFYHIAGSVTIAALEKWIKLGMPAGELIEY